MEEQRPVSPAGRPVEINMEGGPHIVPEPSEPKKFLAGIVVAFSFVITLGLIWFFVFSPASPIGAGWFLFSFAAGLSMIVLPCTLPLAFVIVPLSMGKGVAKGFKIALAFSAGVSLTLSLYGILAAYLGDVAIGTLGAPLEIVKNWFYFIAGLFAYIFALGGLGLIGLRMPTYSGAYPSFIQRQGDIFKALLLGLFLGNVGVGCPHPATPLIFTRIVVSGDVFYGWLLFFVHAVGRVIPLLLLAALGILGLNALSWLTSRREKVERATGWAMLFVAAFILVLGLFSHDWWVYSGTHALFEKLTQEEKFLGVISERLQVMAPHIHGLSELEGKTGLFGLPLRFGSWALLALWIVPLFWYWLVKGGGRLLFWFFVVLSFSLWLTFGYSIPHWFQEHAAFTGDGYAAVPVDIDIRVPADMRSGTPAILEISIKDKEGIDLSESLRYSHERLIHTVIMHEDLETFFHVHPEDQNVLTQEMFTTDMFPLEFTFPKDGRYIVAVDVNHGGHEVSYTELVDVGQRAGSLSKDFSRKKKFDGYDVSFIHEETELVSGKDLHIRYYFEKDGVPVSDLEPYLGAPMHVAIVSADLSSFAHTHGESPEGVEEHHSFRALPIAFAHEGAEEDSRRDAAEISLDSFGPTVFLRHTFRHPGLYAVFGEFKHQGKIIVTKFMIEVGVGEEAGLSMLPGHNED